MATTDSIVDLYLSDITRFTCSSIRIKKVEDNPAMSTNAPPPTHAEDDAELKASSNRIAKPITAMTRNRAPSVDFLRR